MEIEYLRTSRKSYMIVKDADYVFENYELQMILHNEIPNLLEFQVIVGDGTVEYWYDVTGMQSLQKQYTVTAVDESQLRFFLQNLVSMKNAMEEYLLDDHNLSYSLEMVYYDRFTERIRFCYIPGLAEQQTSEMKDLFGEILQYLNHSDSAAVRLGYEMYERSIQSDFLVEDCIECLTNHEFKKEPWRPQKDLFEGQDDMLFSNTGERNRGEMFGERFGESGNFVGSHSKISHPDSDGSEEFGQGYNWFRRNTPSTGSSFGQKGASQGKFHHRNEDLSSESYYENADLTSESFYGDTDLARSSDYRNEDLDGGSHHRNEDLERSSYHRNVTVDGNFHGEEYNSMMEGEQKEPYFGEKRSRKREESSKGFWKKRRWGKRRKAVNYSEILDEEQRNFYAAEEIQGKNYTECFSAENMEICWKLIYKGDGDEQDIMLVDFPFLLGTDKEKVQGVLRSRTVSRVHARLYLEEGILFLEDYNSTNGTYVNHRLIPMNTPTQLQPGDRVVFATEEFMVSCRRMPKS